MQIELLRLCGSAVIVTLTLICGKVPAQSRESELAKHVGVVERDQLSMQRAIDYDFQSVEVDDITAWLRWFGVEIPVETSGQLSGWVWAQASENGWFTFQNYRIEGAIESPRLTIDGWLFDHASMRFGYADGTWFVGSLQGKVNSLNSDHTIGQVHLTSRLPMTGSRVVEVSGTVNEIDLGALLQSSKIDTQLAGKGGLIEFSASVPLADINHISSWTASASVRLDPISWADLPPAILSANAELSSSQWAIEDGQLEWIGQQLTFGANGRLDSEYPFQCSLSGRQLPIPELLEQLGQPTIASQLKGHVNLTAVAEGKGSQGVTRASANIDSKELLYRGQTFNDIRMVAEYTPTNIQLNIDTAKFASGQLTAFSRWSNLASVANGIPDTLQLTLKDIDLGEMSDLVPLQEFSGIANGEIHVQSSRRDEEILWSSKGSVAVAELSAFKAVFGDSKVEWLKALDSDDFNLQLEVADRSIASQIIVKLGDSVSHSLRDTSIVAYSIRGQLIRFHTQYPITSLQNDSLTMEATGQFEIQGNPNSWLETGSAELQEAVVVVQEQTLHFKNARLRISPTEFRLQQFQVFDERGRIAGSGVIRRVGNGNHQLNLRIAGVEIAPYLQKSSSQALAFIQGMVSLDARLSKPASEPDHWTAWEGHIAGEISKLHSRGVPIGQIAIDGTVSNDLFHVTLAGNLLGGEAKFRGSFPLGLMDWTNQTRESTFRGLEFDAKLAGFEIPRLIASFSDNRSSTSYAGAATVEINGSTNEQSLFTVESQIKVPLLKHDRTVVAKDFSARMTYSDEVLELVELSGAVAGGRMDARGVVKVPYLSSDQLEGEIRFDAQRVHVDELIRLRFPDYADQFTGGVSYRGSVRVNQNVNIVGDAHVFRGSWFGIPIQNLHGDLRMSLATNGSLLALSSRNISGLALGGNFIGSAQIRGGSKDALKASGRVSNGKLEQLSKAMGFERIVGSGRFDGSFDLASHDASTLAALTGQVQLEFEDGDARSVPLLSDLTRYVPLLSLASSKIKSGTMQAKIGQGELRIQNLLLNSDAFWIAANGNASLTGKRLDIDALVQTGGGIEEQLSQRTLEKLAIELLPQVVLVTQINDLIQNRTLYVHVDGTNHRPFVRPKAAQTIARALLQNLRRQLLAIPVATQETSLE